MQKRHAALNPGRASNRRVANIGCKIESIDAYYPLLYLQIGESFHQLDLYLHELHVGLHGTGDACTAHGLPLDSTDACHNTVSKVQSTTKDSRQQALQTVSLSMLEHA